MTRDECIFTDDVAGVDHYNITVLQEKVVGQPIFYYYYKFEYTSDSTGCFGEVTF